MRRALQNAPGSTIFLIFLLIMAQVVSAADLPAGATDAPTAPQICFPLVDGERILRDLESLPPCQAAVAAGEDAVNSCEVRAEALEDRVAEQDGELADARKVIDDTRKAGEQAVKAGQEPWYVRVLSAAKWVALGLVVGFIGGMSK